MILKAVYIASAVICSLGTPAPAMEGVNPPAKITRTADAEGAKATSTAVAETTDDIVAGSMVVAAATDVKEVILDKARKRLAGHFSSANYRFNMVPRWIPKKILRLKPQSITAVELSGSVERYTEFEVVYQYRGERKKVGIQLAVEVEQKLPVVKRRIPKGEVIAEEDLEYQWVSLARNRGALIEKTGSLSGKVLSRTLLAGQPIRSSYVSLEYIIEAGDQVKIIMQKQGVRVQLVGEARESGAKGDEINIYSEETRRKYVGEIIRPGVTTWKNTL